MQERVWFDAHPNCQHRHLYLIVITDEVIWEYSEVTSVQSLIAIVDSQVVRVDLNFINRSIPGVLPEV